MNEDPSIKNSVMQAIRERKVQMRPRWHFVLLSALAATGALLGLLTLMYVFSLWVFFLQQNGAWFAPSFGMRGWIELFRSLPWLLIILSCAFIVILETLVRRYEFVYKKPLMLSIAGIFVIVIGGGMLVALTPLHRELQYVGMRGALPPPMDQLYGPGVRFKMRAENVKRGLIVGTTSQGFIIDEDGQPTTIIVTRATRLPYGEDFTVGDVIVVVGDRTATDTVQAFGIRAVKRLNIDDSLRR